MKYYFILFMVLFFSCTVSVPDFQSSRDAKIYLLPNLNDNCPFQPTSSGWDIKMAFINQDGEEARVDDINYNDLKYDGTGYYKNHSIPTGGLYGIKLYAWGPCGFCCISSPSGQSRPIYKGGNSEEETVENSHTIYITVSMENCSDCFGN